MVKKEIGQFLPKGWAKETSVKCHCHPISLTLLGCRGFTNLHTQSPLRKILPFPKYWQLSNFWPVCPCWEHGKKALKRAASKRDPSAPLPQSTVKGASLCALRCAVYTLSSPRDRELLQGRSITVNFSVFHSTQGLAHGCLIGIGKPIQVSTDSGNTTCSDAGDCLYLAYLYSQTWGTVFQ